MNYLFVGEDEFSKDIRLKKIKHALFTPSLEAFNFEILYAKELNLKTLQEKLLLLPVKASRRLILIKDVTRLKPDAKKYIVTFLKKPLPHISLILDARRIDAKVKFFSQISRFVEAVYFRQSKEIDVFTLARQVVHPAISKSSVGQKKIQSAMCLLRQLFLQGQRPENILGVLRYQLSREKMNLLDKKKKLKLLLNCDIDIKTGRLKPEFALERLFVRLCCF